MNAQVTYALITHPSIAMRKLRTAGALGTGIMVMIAGAISFSVSYSMIEAQVLGSRGPVVLTAFALLVTLTTFSMWLFTGGLTHAAACLMGGYGNFGRFLAAYGLTMAPFTLCTPAVLLLTLVGMTGSYLFVLAVLPMIFIWSWILTIIAIKEIYGLSAGAATVASLLPYLIIAVMTALTFATFAVSAAMYVAG